MATHRHSAHRSAGRMSAPQFRIQGRGPGEAWKTLHTCDHLGIAATLFGGMAKEARAAGRLDLPRWPYMRLVLGDVVLRERSMADWSQEMTA